MNVSLNEVEATAKRAARGAGYPWGLAEEAGKATRWLCAHGIDGTKSLAQLLEQGLAASLKNHRPVEMQSAWAGQGVLCPIITGALLSDRSDLLHAGPIRIQNLAVPVYLLPFVASAARAQGSVISLTSDLFSAATDGGHLESGQEWPALSDHVQIALGGQLSTPRPQVTRATPDPDSWDTLNRFAHRTYAPATEESRLLGAGAGLSDND